MTMMGCILIGAELIYQLPTALMTMNMPLSGSTYIPTNRWEPVYEEFYRLMTPMDEGSAIAFWIGIDRTDHPGIPWSQWAKMIPLWFINFGSLFIMLLSLATLLRQRWTEEEYLTFPLIGPVLAIVNVGSGESSERIPLF
jgi:hypothetical protein